MESGRFGAGKFWGYSFVTADGICGFSQFAPPAIPTSLPYVNQRGEPSTSGFAAVSYYAPRSMEFRRAQDEAEEIFKRKVERAIFDLQRRDCTNCARRGPMFERPAAIMGG